MLLYVQSGEFDQKDKLTSSAHQLLKLNLIYAAVGIVFLIYLWFSGTFESITLSGFIIAATNVIGLF